MSWRNSSTIGSNECHDLHYRQNVVERLLYGAGGRNAMNSILRLFSRFKLRICVSEEIVHCGRMLHPRRSWSRKEKNGCRTVMFPMMKLKIDHEPERLRVHAGSLAIRDGRPPETIHHYDFAGFERRNDGRLQSVDMRGYMQQLLRGTSNSRETVLFR